MTNLEGNASWYEKLPPSSLYSLRDFHTMFYEHFKENYPSILLVKNCCTHVESSIKHLKNMYGDQELMDEEILEVLCETPFQHHDKI